MMRATTEVLLSIPSPSTDRIELGPLDVRAYGVFIAIGVVVAVWITTRRYAKVGDESHVGAIATWAVPAGIVGARLYHVATDWPRFRGRWLDAFAIWEGGLGIWGAIAAGAVAAWFAARRYGASFTDFADAAAPGILVAQAIGRLGNWFNQELFGRPTDLPWALEIDPANRPDRFAESPTFHPTFLYEALWNLGLAALLVVAQRRWRLDRGRVFALYAAGYTVGRLWIELMRVDPASKVLGLRVNVWTSVIVFAGAMAYFLWQQRRSRSRAGTDEAADPVAEDIADEPAEDAAAP